MRLEEFVQTLRAGGVVGMPTETVYGLAADARRADAVAKVFALKGRPSTNPLIVHVASVEVAERYAVADDRARKLFATFAPGPLTVVLPRRDANAHRWPSAGVREEVCDIVSAGLNTIGVRIPDHPLALELLRAFDGPLAAPSANKSNHISPTTAEHVRSEFGDSVSVIDGGPCRVGIESTVLSLATERPIILRPGHVSRDAIESVIGPVDLFQGHVSAATAASAPGQHEKHYAPTAPAFRCDIATIEALAQKKITPTAVRPDSSSRTATESDPTAQRSAWIVFCDLRIGLDEPIVVLGDEPDRAAQLFYATLRDLDQTNPDAIFIELPPDEPRWTALRDRITRATRPYIADR